MRFQTSIRLILPGLALVLGSSAPAIDKLPAVSGSDPAAPKVSVGVAKSLAAQSPPLRATVPLLGPEYDWARNAVQNTGSPVIATDYSWQVGLRIRFGPGWRCGGILISRVYILTAAHCVDADPPGRRDQITSIGLGQIDVVHGSEEFDRAARLPLDPTWRVRIHPGWKTSDRMYEYDAALLRLASPLTHAVSAPVRSTPFYEGRAVISGWGDHQSGSTGVLRAVQVPVVSNDTCRAELPDGRGADITQAALCAISPIDDACARDSGGPMVIGSSARPQTIGIVSWGFTDQCGVAVVKGLRIGVYTRASEIAAWVREQTGDTATTTDRAPDPLFTVRPRIGARSTREGVRS